jgi:prephenate dehydrogenase
MINKLAIIGVGLIGGSLARALKRAGVCNEVIGGGRDAVRLKKAVELGVIDRFELDMGVTVRDADMVVIAVPVGSIESVLQSIVGQLAPHAVLTDVGSVKASVVETVQRVFKKTPDNFVPGHPIAGTEQCGVEASRADLFQGRRVALTPLADTHTEAVSKVRAMWEATGAEVVEMEMRHHDEVLAATSHLPHLLAYSLVDMLARMDTSEEIFGFAAGGFRDFTRIAGSSPRMWHDICLANPGAILTLLERYAVELKHLGEAIRQGDSAGILELLNRAKAARDRFAGKAES